MTNEELETLRVRNATQFTSPVVTLLLEEVDRLKREVNDLHRERYDKLCQRPDCGPHMGEFEPPYPDAEAKA